MVGAALGAAVLTPRLSGIGAVPPLAQAVPEAFGRWQAMPDPLLPAQLAVSPDGRPSTDQPYDDVLTRSYRSGEGHGAAVMLALAWGRSQRQEVKIHRPELCYPAQGFELLELADTQFEGLAGQAGGVVGKDMLTRAGQRLEAVSYWIRIGLSYSDSPWRTRWHILREGLEGRIPDGMLVRASRIIATPHEAPAAHAVLHRFLVDLVQALPAPARGLLVR
jgi:EpsI family protein